jgi:hypothetical protein
MILVALLSATFVNTYVTSYTNTKLTDTISYHVNDGWCDPKIEGFGPHCFGDYYAPLQYANSESPWNGFINNYPPFSFILLKPFAYIHEAFPGRASLALYFLLMVCCLVIPVIHLKLHYSLNSLKLLAIFGVSIISGPAITVIDRGNVLAFAFPFIYLYFHEVKKMNYRRAIIYGTVFILIKPQLVVLSLVLIAMRKYRETILLYLSVGVGTLISFGFYPTFFLQNIRIWIRSTINYQSAGAVGVLEPVNVSVKSSVDVVFNIFGSQLNQSLLSVIVNILALYFIIRFVLKFSSRKFSHNVMIVILFPILFMGTTYHYYLILLIIPLAVFMTESDEVVLTGYPRKVNYVFGIVFVTVFTPLALPWALTGRFTGRGWENISSTWLVAQMVLTIAGIYLNQVSESRSRDLQLT